MHCYLQNILPMQVQTECTNYYKLVFCLLRCLINQGYTLTVEPNARSLFVSCYRNLRYERILHA